MPVLSKYKIYMRLEGQSKFQSPSQSQALVERTVHNLLRTSYRACPYKEKQTFGFWIKKARFPKKTALKPVTG
jgi:hypothetical protein